MTEYARNVGGPALQAMTLFGLFGNLERLPVAGECKLKGRNHGFTRR